MFKFGLHVRTNGITIVGRIYFRILEYGGANVIKYRATHIHRFITLSMTHGQLLTIRHVIV